MSSTEFWKYHDKAKPEHNTRARKIFRELYPAFDDMDPEKVTPLIAPAPCLIVSGALDDQFNPAGVVEVDLAMQKSYKSLGFPECSELFIQSREGHSVGLLAADDRRLQPHGAAVRFGRQHGGELQPQLANLLRRQAA